ncbi:MAG: metabolite traffic protein EboE [Actinomycetes bacterium]
MRLLHGDGQVVHLSYCTNVHPAEDLDGIVAQLDRYAVPVRHELGAGRLGLGLWLAAPVAAVLARSPRRIHRLRHALSSRGLEVVTLNGFPYQGFQQRVVKHAVYRPDWTTSERLAYTADLAVVLAELLPDDAARGSISTLPLAWREPWDGAAESAALRNLARLGDVLDEVRQRTGRAIRVGLEPEPGCVVETTEQAVDVLARLGHPDVGLCLDACHLAVAFEQPDDAVARLQEAGVPVVKTQASAALAVADPSDPATRTALRGFAEERFLHQVRECPLPGDRARGTDDLDEALEGGGPSGTAPWHVHFHVPLGSQPGAPAGSPARGGLASTLPHLEATLAGLFAGPEALTDHVEAETYTWGVLPPEERPRDDAALAVSIARELAWLRDTLVAQGLKELD